MKNNRALALATAAAFALGALSPLAAQQSTGQPSTGQPSTGQQQPTGQPNVPPVVNATVTTPTITIKPPQNKFDRYKGRVLVFNIATIVVQSTDNPRMVWSFQYSLDLHNKVADMLSGAAYQPGDKVTVYCNRGTTVAVKLKGKPSKPV